MATGGLRTHAQSAQQLDRLVPVGRLLARDLGQGQLLVGVLDLAHPP